MATLADKKQSEIINPIHLLLIGPSKVGKTHYIANLIKDGFTVLYVDNDNGLNTLLSQLGDNEDAKARCHYIGTRDLWNFVVYFFARTRFQWNETKDSLFNATSAADDDDILEIYPKQIPFGVVIVIDSWTSLTLQLLRDSAEKNGASIEDFGNSGQGIYGDANRRATTVCHNIQGFPGHVIVQAHPEFYERMEKPPGKNAPQQKDMIVKETVMIPNSVTRNHGYAMPKYFNEVGWMKVSPMGAFKLDFKQLPDRVGGGTKMNEGDPNTEYRFSNLVKPREVPDGWIRTVKAAGLKVEAAEEAERRKQLAIKQAEERKAAAATNPTQAKPAPAIMGSMLGKK